MKLHALVKTLDFKVSLMKEFLERTELNLTFVLPPAEFQALQNT